MQDNNIREKCRELATRLYELDGEVYESVGSSLGRTFTGDREGTIRNLSALMYTKPDGHLLRSEMALISNMARTIKDKEEKSRLMKKYDEIFQEILTLPETFVATDIMDKERVALNHMIKRREKISENDHLVICISRTQGSAGNDIGFGLADKLRINYYDVEIFDQVLRRLEAEKGAVNDAEYFADFNKYEKKHKFDLKGWFREFNRYHDLRSGLKRGLHHYGKVCGCDPQKQSHSTYQSVYHSSFCYPCAACYGCKEDEYEAGSPFPEKDGQPAQTVLQFLRRSSVGQAG